MEIFKNRGQFDVYLLCQENFGIIVLLGIQSALRRKCNIIISNGELVLRKIVVKVNENFTSGHCQKKLV